MAKNFFLLAPLAHAFLSEMPEAFKSSPSTWAYYSYQDPGARVLPGSFNRSVFEAPFESVTSDVALTKTNLFLNTTDFIAYDEAFFDLIGPHATVEHVQHLDYQSHEAPCYNPRTHELFFVEWGPPGGQAGVHSWQYLLNTKNNTLRNITTTPPTTNVHGCVVYQGDIYVVTDGSHNETGSLNKINPATLEKTVVLNNYYQQPFMGLNDLEIDENGNFWMTDSVAGWGRDIIPFTPPTNPTVYMVNGTNFRPKVIHITTGNANGIAISPPTTKPRTIYIPDTGASKQKPVSRKDPYGDRAMYAYDISDGNYLINKRILNNPISYFYDGIRVSRNGWIFTGAGDGVDVVDPKTGLTLGTIRIGGGGGIAVNIAFGRNELWIVGQGGVWHVNGIKERLDRDW